MALISIDIICDNCGDKETVTDKKTIKEWNAVILEVGLDAKHLCGFCYTQE